MTDTNEAKTVAAKPTERVIPLLLETAFKERSDLNPDEIEDHLRRMGIIRAYDAAHDAALDVNAKKVFFDIEEEEHLAGRRIVSSYAALKDHLCMVYVDGFNEENPRDDGEYVFEADTVDAEEDLDDLFAEILTRLFSACPDMEGVREAYNDLLKEQVDLAKSDSSGVQTLSLLPLNTEPKIEPDAYHLVTVGINAAYDVARLSTIDLVRKMVTFPPEDSSGQSLPPEASSFRTVKEHLCDVYIGSYVREHQRVHGTDTDDTDEEEAEEALDLLFRTILHRLHAVCPAFEGVKEAWAKHIDRVGGSVDDEEDDDEKSLTEENEKELQDEYIDLHDSAGTMIRELILGAHEALNKQRWDDLRHMMKGLLHPVGIMRSFGDVDGVLERVIHRAQMDMLGLLREMMEGAGGTIDVEDWTGLPFYLEHTQHLQQLVRSLD